MTKKAPDLFLSVVQKAARFSIKKGVRDIRPDHSCCIIRIHIIKESDMIELKRKFRTTGIWMELTPII